VNPVLQTFIDPVKENQYSAHEGKMSTTMLNRGMDKTLAHESHFNIITLKSKRDGMDDSDEFKSSTRNKRVTEPAYLEGSKSQDPIDKIDRLKKFPEKYARGDIDNVTLRYRDHDQEKKKLFMDNIDKKVMVRFHGYKLHHFDPILQEYGDKQVEENARKQISEKRELQLQKYDKTLPEFIKNSDGSNYNLIDMTVRNKQVLDDIDAKNESSLGIHYRNQELLKEMKKKRMKQAIKKADKRALNKTVPAKYIEYEKGYDTITNQSFTGLDSIQAPVDFDILKQDDMWGLVNGTRNRTNVFSRHSDNTNVISEMKHTFNRPQSEGKPYATQPKNLPKPKPFLPPQRLKPAATGNNLTSIVTPVPSKGIVTNAKMINSVMRRLIRTNGFSTEQ
jgi:hypothetical protein